MFGAEATRLLLRVEKYQHTCFYVGGADRQPRQIGVETIEINRRRQRFIQRRCVVKAHRRRAGRSEARADHTRREKPRLSPEQCCRKTQLMFKGLILQAAGPRHSRRERWPGQRWPTDRLPKRFQLLQPPFRSIADDDGSIDRAHGDAANPVGLERVLPQSLKRANVMQAPSPRRPARPGRISVSGARWRHPSWLVEPEDRDFCRGDFRRPQHFDQSGGDRDALGVAGLVGNHAAADGAADFRPQSSWPSLASSA